MVKTINDLISITLERILSKVTNRDRLLRPTSGFKLKVCFISIDVVVEINSEKYSGVCGSEVVSRSNTGEENFYLN